ncbi:ral guanine nucleotide dissociation stimulator-like [Ursus arctos]|uniref:ral guanine nucleotide dissociation stimulator-like n=1 Tax=Ursus arctos TaxID=9644 RepID=UPI0025497355|nr:ral guanine nucleotide dissociation stimulator-like [Ursus arctos]XP_057162425.1 ral guanine nucleotide dissociation stimulator-like [Ursus arctos]
MGSDSQEPGTQGPRLPQGLPGASAWEVPCPLTPLPNLSVPRVISSVLGTWLDHYPEDFFQPPEFPCLKTLLAYVGLLVPGSDLEQRAWLLLSRLRHLEPAEPEAGAAAPERDPRPRRKLVPPPTVVPDAASEPELENPITAAGAQQLKRAGTSSVVSGPVQLVVRALIHREDVQESPAPLESQEPQQAPAPATEVPEEPEMTPPTSEPRQDILTALTPCRELEESPAPLESLEPAQAPALPMEVPEGTLMPPALSETAQDILTALTPSQELQEPRPASAAPEPEQPAAPASEVPKRAP